MAETRASSTSAAPAWGSGTSREKDPRRWYTLAAVNFALFMTLLDVTVVNVALPNIARDFSTSFANLQWVIATYTLVYATLVLTAAKIGDLFGRKRLFLVGLVIFTVASLGCALSQDVTQLQIARGVQGVGAAILSPIAGAIISSTFWGPELGTAFGIYGGVSGIALALGPIIGGVLVKYVNWQSVFLINVPIGIIGFVVGVLVIKESRSERGGRTIDFAGVALSIVTLFALTLGLIKGEEWGWTNSKTLAAFAVTIIGFIAFLFIESALVRNGKDAMVDLHVFRVPTFNAVAVVTLVISLIYAGLFLILALLFQNVLGYDALGTGLRYIPIVIGSIFIAPVVGALGNRMDTRILFSVSLVVFGFGLLLLIRIAATSDWSALLPGLIITGIGGAALQSQLTTVAVSSAPREQAGLATGISSTMRQVGSSVGIALLGAVFTTRYGHYLPGSLADANVPDQFAQQLIRGTGGNVSFAGRVPPQVPPQFAPAIQNATHSAFIAGFHDMIYVAVALTGVALAASLLFIRAKDLHFAQRGGKASAPPVPVAAGH